MAKVEKVGEEGMAERFSRYLRRMAFRRKTVPAGIAQAFRNQLLQLCGPHVKQLLVVRPGVQGIQVRRFPLSPANGQTRGAQIALGKLKGTHVLQRIYAEPITAFRLVGLLFHDQISLKTQRNPAQQRVRPVKTALHLLFQRITGQGRVSCLMKKRQKLQQYAAQIERTIILLVPGLLKRGTQNTVSILKIAAQQMIIGKLSAVAYPADDVVTRRNAELRRVKMLQSRVQLAGTQKTSGQLAADGSSQLIITAYLRRRDCS